MNPNKCPLCNFELLSKPSGPGQDELMYYECPHCGRFKIDIDNCEMLPYHYGKKSDLGHILSYYSRKIQSTSDIKWPLINSDKIEKFIKTGSLPAPQEQAEYLIYWLGSNLSGPGEAIKLSWKEHGAIIGAKSPEGFNFIILGLMEEGLVPETKIGVGSEANVTLSFKGWHKFEELRRGISTGKKAFMAMPFGKNNIDNIVDNYFRIAVRETGFKLTRLDDEPKAGLIDDRLRVEIKTSRFLIADLTYDNNGAYWEAGYAEGLGKPVIYTCAKEHFQKGTHFDTNHHLTVIWDEEKPEEAVYQLKATIRATLPDSIIEE